MNTGCGGGSNSPTPTPTATITPPPNATATIPPTASPTPPPANDIAKIQRTYYTLGGQMIGVRVKEIRSNGTTKSDKLYYTYTDHLGSVTALSDANGNFVSDSLALFRPFGSYRLEPATNPEITNRGFTGHKENRDIGLTYMNARYYLGEVGQFISADTIVPDPMNPQQFNRYTYSLNSPTNFTDPTGHRACASTEMCAAGSSGAHYQLSIRAQSAMYGIIFTADSGKSWTSTQQQVALIGVRDVDNSLRNLPEFNGYSQGQAFQEVFGSVTFHRSSKTQWTDAQGNVHDIDYGAQAFGRRIEFYDDATGVDPLNPKFRYNVVHELGHVFNYMINENSDANPYAALGGALGGALPSRNTVRKGMEPYPLQQNTRSTKNENYELFADGFLNWTYGSFRGNTEGNQTSNWFNTQMPLWVSATGS